MAFSTTFGTKEEFDALKDGDHLIVIKDPEIKEYWQTWISELGISQRHVVRLPGFLTNNKRRQYFENVENYLRCLNAAVVWLPNDRIYSGHSELLIYWLRKHALVLVDSTEAIHSYGVICVAPLCYQYVDILSDFGCRNVMLHTPAQVRPRAKDSNQLRDITNYVRKFELNRNTNATLSTLGHGRRMFSVKIGQLIHFHCKNMEAVSFLRQYYQALYEPAYRLLLLNEEAITLRATQENELLIRQYRYMVEKLNAKFLFFVFSEKSRSTQLNLNEVMHYLTKSLKQLRVGIIICSVGDLLVFDRALKNYESERVNHVDFPAIEGFQDLDASQQRSMDALHDILVDKVLDDNTSVGERLLASYIQFG